MKCKSLLRHRRKVRWRPLMLCALTLFIVFGLSVSCETHESIVREEGYKIQHLNNSDLERNLDLFNSTAKFRKQTSPTGRIIDTQFGFAIDTDDFVAITEGDKASYTFRVVRENEPDSKENLVFKKMADGGYHVFLRKYILSEIDLQRLKEGLPIENIDEKTIKSQLNPETGRFTIILWETCTQTVISDTYTEVWDDEGVGTWTHTVIYTEDCSYAFETIGNPGGPGAPGTDWGPAPIGDIGNPPHNNGGGPGDGTDPGSGTNPTNPGGDDEGDDDNGTESQEEIISDPNNPLVTIPLVNRKKECQKIQNQLSNNPNFKNRIKDIALPANLNLNYEIATIGPVGGSVTITSDFQGTPGNPEALIAVSPGDNITMFVHSHPQIGAGTLAVFSMDDLIAMTTLFRKGNTQGGTFVAYLATKKGTYLALTIPDPQRLLDIFYSRSFLAGDVPTATDIARGIQSNTIAKPFITKYFDVNNPNHLINTTDANEKVLENFLKFIDEANVGMNLFETDANFDNFTQLKLKSNGIDRVPCP